MPSPILTALEDNKVPLSDALHALAFMGDISMGQPTDHSTRVAMLGSKLAQSLGLDDGHQQLVKQIALLRWSGCTANAMEVSSVISDDVEGRAAMLAMQVERISILIVPELVNDRISRISAIHCEVSSLVAQLMQLSPEVVDALTCVFEHWDGSGQPQGRRENEIPLLAQIVAIVSELDIFTRNFGVKKALLMLTTRSGSIHEKSLVEIVTKNAEDWLLSLSQDEKANDETREIVMDRQVSLVLLADVIDLKLPWLLGHSRAVSGLADLVAAHLTLPAQNRKRVRIAGLIHGLGRTAIPNAIWNKACPLTVAEWEKVRLSPYWTSRAAKVIKGLQLEAEMASGTYERLDGSGYFRSSSQSTTSFEQRILPAVNAFLAMQADRPWRPALSRPEALAILQDLARLGKFDLEIVKMIEAVSSEKPVKVPHITTPSAALTPRELDVLRRVSLGDSNKDAAARLGISPSTVRTHMESVFRKLACNSRSAATLRASMLGLL